MIPAPFEDTVFFAGMGIGKGISIESFAKMGTMERRKLWPMYAVPVWPPLLTSLESSFQIWMLSNVDSATVSYARSA